MSDVRAWIKER